MSRITIYIAEDLLSQVKAIADEKKRSASYTISLLLQRAIDEKNRKKKTWERR